MKYNTVKDNYASNLEIQRQYMGNLDQKALKHLRKAAEGVSVIESSSSNHSFREPCQPFEFHVKYHSNQLHE